MTHFHTIVPTHSFLWSMFVYFYCAKYWTEQCYSTSIWFEVISGVGARNMNVLTPQLSSWSIFVLLRSVSCHVPSGDSSTTRNIFLRFAMLLSCQLMIHICHTSIATRTAFHRLSWSSRTTIRSKDSTHWPRKTFWLWGLPGNLGV